jgi:hypothetical protein
MMNAQIRNRPARLFEAPFQRPGLLPETEFLQESAAAANERLQPPFDCANDADLRECPTNLCELE